MKRLLAAALLLCLACPAWAADVKLPAEVNAKPGRLTQLTAETTGKLVRWACASAEADVIAIREDGRKAIFSSPTPGQYVVLAWTAEGDVPSEAARCIVTVGDVPPPGPGPTPPGPGPGPVPPGPTPPGPGPVAGLRVLIVEETADRTKLPAAQANVLFAKSVRDYLNAHCADWPEGKIKDWGIFDKDADLSGYSKALRDMLARPRKSLPWVVISGDKGVAYEGPLPGSVDETLALLKKYGGN